MSRIIEVIIFHGCQGLALRGHRESLENTAANAGNFFELLKLLSEYDNITSNHMEKVKQQEKAALTGQARKSKPRKMSNTQGRASTITFLSNDSQDAFIDIISEQTTSKIADLIQDSAAWALMATEQLSNCLQILHRNGTCSEHFLAGV